MLHMYCAYPCMTTRYIAFHPTTSHCTISHQMWMKNTLHAFAFQGNALPNKTLPYPRICKEGRTHTQRQAQRHNIETHEAGWAPSASSGSNRSCLRQTFGSANSLKTFEVFSIKNATNCNHISVLSVYSNVFIQMSWNSFT